MEEENFYSIYSNNLDTVFVGVYYIRHLRTCVDKHFSRMEFCPKNTAFNEL